MLGRGRLLVLDSKLFPIHRRRLPVNRDVSLRGVQWHRLEELTLADLDLFVASPHGFSSLFFVLSRCRLRVLHDHVVKTQDRACFGIDLQELHLL